jgi:hypothetical protein
METTTLEIGPRLIDKCHGRGGLWRRGALAALTPFPISGQRREFLT